MKDRIIIAIGGGEIKSKATLKIDEYIANLVKSRTEGRPTGLFIGTASHDSMPYFNSFRKTYTSNFDIKADCALLCYNEMNMEKIAAKIEKADFIYVGGGDTVFMLNKWAEAGLDKLILKAYRSGTVLCGLSAGAICWFKNMYTDSDLVNKDGGYSFYDGLGVLDGICAPHFDDRVLDFNEAFIKEGYKEAYGIENLSALVFKNEVLQGSLSCGGNSYVIRNNNGAVESYLVKTLTDLP